MLFRGIDEMEGGFVYAIVVCIIGWVLFRRMVKMSGWDNVDNDNGRTVTGLRIYPVKSCGGVEVGCAKVTARGLEGDRMLMVIDGTRNALTQRIEPRMALIKPSIDSGREGKLVIELHADGASMRHSVNLCGNVIDVTLFGESVAAIDQGDTAAEFLSSFLRRPVRLVAMRDDCTRTVANKHDETPVLSFADSYPILLASEASCARVAEHVAEGGPMIGLDRFRPNVIVSTCEAFEEDGWDGIKIGEFCRLNLVEPCVRCKLPTVNQDTGVFDPNNEPTNALREFRCVGKQAVFGQLAFPVDTLSLGNVIKVGDLVSVFRTKSKVRTAAYS